MSNPTLNPFGEGEFNHAVCFLIIIFFRVIARHWPLVTFGGKINSLT